VDISQYLVPHSRLFRASHSLVLFSRAIALSTFDSFDIAKVIWLVSQYRQSGLLHPLPGLRGMPADVDQG
jgi:hypothetical protein